MFQDRIYQIEAVDNIFNYWSNNPGKGPVIVLPTGSGKSVVCPRIFERMYEKYHAQKLRMIVTVPSKELCEQNAEKISSIMNKNISVDVYSASVGRKNAQADIVCATIGSVRNYPSELGYRNCWLNDECHLANVDGTGAYWKFAEGMHQANYAARQQYCWGGLTATPFKGNGVWITHGSKTLYHGIAHETRISELLSMGYLAPLVNPQSNIETRIDTKGVEIKGTDFDVVQLAERTKKYLVHAAHEAKILARDRSKWMAFLPDVSSAHDFSLILNQIGISAAVVTGDTPTSEREYLIDQYRKGYIRCLITVIALTTGFDVPEIDCILWLRSTHSLVLYMQGAGRGTRTAPGKANCLWIDFTDTTERLGAIDQIRGRSGSKKQKVDAPFITCDECGAKWTPASKEVCAEFMKDSRGNYVYKQDGSRILTAGCGNIMRKPEDLLGRYATKAEVMASVNPYPEFPVDAIQVREKVSKKNGRNFISVEFFWQMGIICKLQLYMNDRGLTPESRKWFNILSGDYYGVYNTIQECIDYLNKQLIFNKTLGLTIVKLDRTQNAKYPRLVEVFR